LTGSEGSAAGVLLTLVTGGARSRRDLASTAADAAAAGVDYLQLREPQLEDRELLQVADAVLEATRGSRLRILINSRPDVARLCDAAGVQLPESGLPVEAVRRAFPELVIGASCHSVEAARRAEAGGADFVLFGAVFGSGSKPAAGLAALSEVVRAVAIPVHAIGGIRPENAAAAVAAGARGLAAIGAFLDGPIGPTAARLMERSRP
jgi:thiamine-phosphate diphosphorylase